MLYFRTTEGAAPIETPCSFCKYVSPPNETFHILEVDPTEEDDKGNIVDMEFQTACPECYRAIKEAVLRFGKHFDKIIWEFDPNGLRMAVEGETRQRTF